MMVNLDTGKWLLFVTGVCKVGEKMPVCVCWLCLQAGAHPWCSNAWLLLSRDRAFLGCSSGKSPIHTLPLPLKQSGSRFLPGFLMPFLFSRIVPPLYDTKEEWQNWGKTDLLFSCACFFCMIFNLFLDEEGFFSPRKGLCFKTGENISEPPLNVQININGS